MKVIPSNGSLSIGFYDDDSGLQYKVRVGSNDEVSEVKYFYAPCEEEENAVEDTNSTASDSDEKCTNSFLAMRVEPSESNMLNDPLYHSMYAKSLSVRTRSDKKYIVLEFRSGEDLRSMLESTLNMYVD